MQKFERMYQTLWFMQAHLKDLALAHHGSESFLICQRVLNQCHEMIYADLPASTTPYSTLNIPKIPGFLRKKVKSHVPPAFIGISMILAGVPAMPSLTEVMGEVAIEQGRLDDQGDDLRSLENLDGIVRPQADHTSDLPDEKDDGNESEEEPQSNPPDVDRPPLSAARLGGSKRKSSPRRQTIASQTSPALPLHLRDPRRPRLSEDPFGQQDHPLPTQSASPFQSTPSFSGSRHGQRPNSLNSSELLLQKYDPSSQMYLLRSHFCRSEVRPSRVCTHTCD